MDIKKHNIVIINSKKFTIQNALEKINENPIGYLLFINEKKVDYNINFNFIINFKY